MQIPIYVTVYPNNLSKSGEQICPLECGDAQWIIENQGGYEVFRCEECGLIFAVRKAK